MRRLSNGMVTSPIWRRPLHLSLFMGSLAWRPELHILFLYTIAPTALRAAESNAQILCLIDQLCWWDPTGKIGCSIRRISDIRRRHR